MSIFGGGGSAPPQPNLKQINIGDVSNQMRAADIAGYAASDANLKQRFPAQIAGRDYNIANAASNLRGETDPLMSGTLQTAGFGTPNLGANEFQQARSLGQPILAKEKRDRNYFQTLLRDNPQRQIGPSGEDTANFAMANVAGGNNLNLSTFGTQILAANARAQQAAQANAALYSSVGSLGAAGIRSQAQPNYNSPYFSSSTYAPYFYSGTSPIIGSEAAGYPAPAS
jgi:hypothetical protein